MIDKYEADIAETEKNAQPITPENSIGRVSRMDAINNKGVLDAALRNKKAKLLKLKIALDKVDSQDFGICKMCNKIINPARMMFMPESTKCFNCADR